MTLQSLDSVAKVTIEVVEEELLLERVLDAAVHWHLDCLVPIVRYSVVLLQHLQTRNYDDELLFLLDALLPAPPRPRPGNRPPRPRPGKTGLLLVMLLFLRKGGRETLGGGRWHQRSIRIDCCCLIEDQSGEPVMAASGGHEISPSSSPISPSSVVLLKDIFTQYYS